MKKVIGILLFVFLLAGNIFAQDTITLYSIKFFEGQYDPTEQQMGKHAFSFPKSQARYIWCDLEVENLLYQKQDKTYKVLFRYYKPDGNFLAEMDADFTVKSEWDYAWVPRGWGWEDSGNWTPGSYRVEVLIDGKVFGESQFTIYDDNQQVVSSIGTPVDRNTKLEYDSLSFFESGYEAPPESQRKYNTAFPSSSTRYVFYQVFAKNLLWKVSDQIPSIVAKYYLPNGEVLCEIVNSPNVSKEWEYANLWHGWGYDNPGSWAVGVYKVEIFFGDTKITQSQFAIYDDGNQQSTTSTNRSVYKEVELEYESVKFFESGYDAPDESARKYNTAFANNNTRYVFYQAEAKNTLWNVRDQDVSIIAKYYNPDGSLLCTIQNDINVPKEWEYTNLWHGWGWDNSGNWTVGVYRVEIFFGSRRVGEGSFAIYE